jgi:hypothetical protein
MGRKSLDSQTARDMALSSKRKRAGGRPRSTAPRCACEAMTLKRADARGKSSEHDSSCPFYRQRV